MVLVDSSTWIEVERGSVSLAELVPDAVAVCPVVVMEVLRGARDLKRYETGRKMFEAVTILDAPTPLVRFEEAARLYVQCRAAGVTASAADCLVAACAIAHDITLVHDDADFDHIASITGLRVFTRS